MINSRRLFVFLCGLISLPLCAATVNACAVLRHHGKLVEAQTCFTSLVASHDAYTRAEGLWGLERYEDARDQFKIALAENKNSAEIRVRWGRLFLERFNKAEADKLFKEALT